MTTKTSHMGGAMSALLSIIIAAALLLAIGFTAQQSFAATGSYGTEINADDDIWVGLPGTSISLQAYTWYDGDGEDPQDCTYTWKLINNGDNFATIQPDTADSSKAVVTFKQQASPIDWQEVWIEVTAKDSKGKTLCSRKDWVTVSDDFYLLSPRRLQNIGVGESITVTTDLTHFTLEAPDGTPVDNVSYAWEYNSAQAKVEVSGNNSAITRLSAKNIDLNLKATFTAPDGNTETVEQGLYLDEISTNLNDYDLRIAGAAERNDSPDVIYIDGTQAITPEITLHGWSDYVLPAENYTLDWEKGNMDDWSFSPTSLPLTVDDNGVGLFRVQAVAKAGTGFKGKTEERDFIVCSRNSVSWPASELTFDKKYYVDPQKKYEGSRYEIPLGIPMAPTVTVDGKVLEAGKDYTVKYINFSKGEEETTTFPTETGDYDCVITGAGSYVGENRVAMFIGAKNPITVKGKTVTLKASKLKKKAQTINGITVSKAKGDVWYHFVDGNAKSAKALKLNDQNGKITVKKGTKKGTYTIYVRVGADGNETYAPTNCVVAVTVKVK